MCLTQQELNDEHFGKKPAPKMVLDHQEVMGKATVDRLEHLSDQVLPFIFNKDLCAMAAVPFLLSYLPPITSHSRSFVPVGWNILVKNAQTQNCVLAKIPCFLSGKIFNALSPTLPEFSLNLIGVLTTEYFLLMVLANSDEYINL